MHILLRSLSKAVMLPAFLAFLGCPAYASSDDVSKASAANAGDTACTRTGATRLAESVTNSIGNLTTDYTRNSACPNDLTYGRVWGICYGKYAVQTNTYGALPPNTSLYMWSKSKDCWGIDLLEPTNPSMRYWNAPVVSRGWSYGYNAPLTPNGGLRVSALNARHASAATPCPATGVVDSVCVKWTMSVPGVAKQSSINTASQTRTKWDALLDIYFHASSDATHPTNTTDASFDLQIFQMLMDWQATNGEAWGTNIVGKRAKKTIGGVTYLVSVNMGDPGTEGVKWVGFGGTLNAVSMFVLPTYPTSPVASRSYLWGSPSVTHDVGGIIAWLSQTETRGGLTGIFDDAGNRLWDNVRASEVAVPLLSPKYYLTGLNAGFEVIKTNTGAGAAPNNTLFTTTDYWVALPGETAGN